MASADDYAAWIVKNADKKGTPEFEIVARAYADARGSGAQPATAPAPAGPPLSTGERVAQGMVDPINGGAQLLTKMLPEGVVKAGDRLNNWLADKTGLVAKLPEGGVDQQTRENEAAYQARRGPDAGIDWARMGGNVISPANAAIAARLPAATGLLNGVRTGAAGGAVSGLMNPVTEGADFLGEKLKQVLGGAAGGAVAAPIVGGVSRVISPKASVNPDVQM